MREREARFSRDVLPQQGEVRVVEIGTHRIGLYRVGDSVYALADRCPHRGAPLCAGAVATPSELRAASSRWASPTASCDAPGTSGSSRSQPADAPWTSASMCGSTRSPSTATTSWSAWTRRAVERTRGLGIPDDKNRLEHLRPRPNAAGREDALIPACAGMTAGGSRRLLRCRYSEAAPSCIAASKARLDAGKSVRRTNARASWAPYSRSIPESSHSMESGPV